MVARTSPGLQQITEGLDALDAEVFEAGRGVLGHAGFGSKHLGTWNPPWKSAKGMVDRHWMTLDPTATRLGERR
jgi:hypothetical protein